MGESLDQNAQDMYHRANLVAEQQVASMLSSLLSPGMSKVIGKINSAAPIISPSPGEIIAAYIRNLVSPDLAAWALGKQGINIGQVVDANLRGIDADNNNRAKLWGAVVEMNRLQPDLMLAIRAYFRRLITAEHMTKQYQIHGVVKESWELVLPALRNWPDPSLAAMAMNRGWIEQKEFAEIIGMSTGERDDCQIMRQKMRQIEQLLGPQEYAKALNRNLLSPIDYYRNVNKKTGLNDESIGTLDELRKTPPGMSEIISLYIRSNGAAALGLPDTMPDEIRSKWGAWAGESWSWQKTDSTTGAQADTTWPDLRWQSYWRSPGWGELREWLWRNAELTDKVSDGEAGKWIEREGVTAKNRQRMLDTRYLPVSVRYLKTMWQMQIVDTPFAESQLKANGQDPAVVDRIILSWIKEKEQKQQAPHAKKQAECAKQIIKAIEADIELGLLDAKEADKELSARGLNPEDWPDCFLAATQRRIHRLKAAILGKVKSLYMSGGLDLQGAANELIAQGFTTEAASEYLQAWMDELSLEIREVAGTSVVRWLRLGLLQAADARSRLTALGFSNPDTALLMLGSDQSADELQSQAVQVLQPGNRVSAAATVRLLKSTERIRKQAQATLRRLTSVATVKKFYIDGKVSEDWVKERLTMMGETAENISLYLADWADAMHKSATKSAKSSQAAATPTQTQTAETSPAYPQSSAPPETAQLSESTISGTSGMSAGTYSQPPPQQ